MSDGGYVPSLAFNVLFTLCVAAAVAGLYFVQRCVSDRKLSDPDSEELRKLFEKVDLDGSGEISVKELIDAGFMSREEAVSNVDTFSKGSGELDVEMFVEMMCPLGYRYSKESTIAYDDTGDGSTIKKDPTDRKWYRETLPPNCDQFLPKLKGP